MRQRRSSKAALPEVDGPGQLGYRGRPRKAAVITLVDTAKRGSPTNRGEARFAANDEPFSEHSAHIPMIRCGYSMLPDGGTREE